MKSVEDGKELCAIDLTCKQFRVQNEYNQSAGFDIAKCSTHRDVRVHNFAKSDVYVKSMRENEQLQINNRKTYIQF